MEKNYIKYIGIIVASVVSIMTLVSLIAPTKFLNVDLKQTNIYSSIIPDTTIRKIVSRDADKSVKILEEKVIKDTLPVADTIIVEEDHQDIDLEENEVVDGIAIGSLMFEDYSIDKIYSKQIGSSLKNVSNKGMRIAFMGDSFIEGDILTMDLRESLQSQYSGSGVGFIPITSPVAKYRGTIKHSFSKGWNINYITKDSKISRYLISGLSFTPKEEGEWVEYTRSAYREHSGKIGSATLLFVNPENSVIEIEVNGQEAKTYTPESSNSLQSITISESIRNIKYTFTGSTNITLYGVILDGEEKGISLDNYSIRENSGIAMSQIDVDLSHEYSNIVDYGLIVVQYGLNVSGQENYSYNSYGSRLKDVVNHMKKCYPDTPIAVMGVSERVVLRNGNPEIMPGIVEINRVQRKLAKESNVLYWSTLDAVQSLGGIAEFVENNWASKDYTHLNAVGGKKVADILFNALNATANDTKSL